MSDEGQMKVRLPAALRKRLEKASDKSGRSLNNEIVWRLEKSFGEERYSQESLVEWLKALETRIEDVEKKR